MLKVIYIKIIYFFNFGDKILDILYNDIFVCFKCKLNKFFVFINRVYKLLKLVL